ncbi:hypothetical protein [Nonomuraea roseola]|uniref:Uncharacterized protein n=1 Tax=Nonomuraea roseola TaxID=46179 RepID=A0ABV5Q4K3_9ACTN
MTSTAYVRDLISTALQEFDDRPLTANVRRAIRIANLVGDTQTAIRLSYELRDIGGDKTSNIRDVQRLMADPGTWHDPSGPASMALEGYLADRRRSPGTRDDTILAHSLDHMDFLDRVFAEIGDEKISDRQWTEQLGIDSRFNEIRSTVRYRVFMALCGWERQLSYQGVRERIFSAQRARVDQLLAQEAPHLMDMFNVAFRRLAEAAGGQPGVAVAEELSQAITSCRRILKAVADHVYPPTPGATTETGAKLDDPAYRNRLREYTKQAIDSGSVAATVEAMIAGVYDRFATLDRLSSKGVHAELALEEAEWCALNTYLVCGEILRIHERRSVSGSPAC